MYAKAVQRVSKSLLSVGSALIARPDAVHWGYELSRTTGVRAGAMYPILRRMLTAGWLEDGWEQLGPDAGRPPRRYYRLTELGREELAALLATRAAPRAAHHTRTRPQAGTA